MRVILLQAVPTTSLGKALYDTSEHGQELLTIASIG